MNSLANRVRTHLRSNVVGYVALFIALTMGTAYATHPSGLNTISSGDIIDGAVKQVDVGNSAINSPRIVDGAVLTPDLGPNAVNGAKVANDSLTGADVKALTGSDIDESSLDYPVWARVDSNGTLLAAGQGGTTSEKYLGQTGVYRVTFPRNVDGCAPIATLVDWTTTDGGSITARTASDFVSPGQPPNIVDVNTFLNNDNAGLPDDHWDHRFYLAVFC